MNYSAFLQLHNEMTLLAVIVILLVIDVFSSEKGYRFFQTLALILFSIHTLLNCVPGEPFEVAGGMYMYYPIHTYIKTILNVGTLIVLLQAHRWLNTEENIIRRGEFYFLTLSTLFGMYLMISAGHFLMFFIGIETAALPMATLVAFNKFNNKSAEAGAKYILSSVFASGLSLFGLSLVYGATGSLYFDDIAKIMTASQIELIGFAFFAVGLFFKISLVPFHLWTPDVYEGAPTSITAYLSVISKGTAVFVVFTIFVKVFGVMIAQWQILLYIIIVLSITVANLFAIRQQNIKRFLAFSSISQAGYIMLGVISGTALGMSSLVYYVLVYMFSNLAVFGVVTIIENHADKTSIRDYTGLYYTNPKLSIVMALALFSLAGIPPFSGFFSKYFIFSAAFKEGFYVLVFIALANTVVSLYFYLKVVKIMFFNQSENPIERISTDIPSKISLIICTLAIVFVGLVSSIFEQISVLGFGI
ncbi:MAG: dehydrogenase subunit [Bacteroidetes bacterium]|nr:dehydrogenase subunit [Bacteroidota bacterium]